jgi:hypothetical protein
MMGGLGGQGRGFFNQNGSVRSRLLTLVANLSTPPHPRVRFLQPAWPRLCSPAGISQGAARHHPRPPAP